MNTRACRNRDWTLSKTRKDLTIVDRPCRKHELTEPTHSNARESFVRFHSYLVELNAWPTPWKHGLSTCGSLVAISHVIGRKWPDRLSSASQLTYWLAIAYRQINKLFFRFSVYLRMRSRHKHWAWKKPLPPSVKHFCRLCGYCCKITYRESARSIASKFVSRVESKGDSQCCPCKTVRRCGLKCNSLHHFIP